MGLEEKRRKNPRVFRVHKEKQTRQGHMSGEEGIQK